MEGGTRPGAGRPKGSGQAAHYRAMLEPYAEELIQRVVDMAALKLCLDRLCAPLRPTTSISLEGLESCSELSGKGESHHEATKRYCRADNLLPEQLKNAIYINPEDAATL